MPAGVLEVGDTDSCRNCGAAIAYGRLIPTLMVKPFWFHTAKPKPTEEQYGDNPLGFEVDPWTRCHPDKWDVAKPKGICWHVTSSGNCTWRTHHDWIREGIYECGTHGKKTFEQRMELQRKAAAAAKREEEQAERDYIERMEKQRRVKSALALGLVPEDEDDPDSGDGWVIHYRRLGWDHKSGQPLTKYYIQIDLDVFEKLLREKGILQ